MALVDRRIVGRGFRRWIFIEGCLESANVVFHQVAAPIVAHPNHVAVFVSSHPARPLRPEPGEIRQLDACQFIKLPVCIRDHSIRSGSSRGHLKLQRLSGLDIGPVHAVDVNLRPPTVALAVRGYSVRPARPIISRCGGVIFLIFMSARIEP